MIDDRSRLTALAFRLLKRKSHLQTTNVVMSPASIFISLVVLAKCAHQETQAVIVRGLGFESLEQMNRFFAALISHWETADPLIEIKTATKLWASVAQLPDDLVQEMNVLFKTELSSNYDQKTAARINAWASQTTRSMISEAVDPLALGGGLLVNLVYFFGLWVWPFNPARRADFHLLDGRVRSHPLMHVSGRWKYYSDPLVQVIELPYKRFQTVSMIVILPTIPWADFTSVLDAKHWNAWLAGMRERDGVLDLPKFKASHVTDLTKPLIECGFEPALVGGRYDPLGIPSLTVPSMWHKVWLEVDEEGSRAAAGTEIALSFSESRFTMRVDRPFCCAIRDNRSGLIVFLGLITDPEELG